MLNTQNSQQFKSLVSMLVMILIAGSSHVALAAEGGASLSLGDGFAGSDAKQYLRPMSKDKLQKVSLVKLPDLEGKAAMRITGNTNVIFVDVPVKEKTKYTLAMRARYDGAESLEENPLLDLFLQFGRRTDVVPQRDIIFVNAQGKRLSSLTTSMVFRQWHQYEDVFYTPADAAFIRLAVDSGQEAIVLLLDNVKLAVTPDEGAINCNPVLSKRGPYNYSGWHSIGVGGKLIEREDGKVIFDTQYSGTSQRFNMSKPGKYELRTVASRKGYSPAIILYMLDANNKLTGRIRVNGITGVREFVLPEGTTHAYFGIRSVLLEELHVVRVGDE